ncbi:MAG: sigma-70 family RNA polymerase sigma factor [Acidobacteriota bacterium]|nr:sigma-70 family RNA polymerase sigma factor [Acidobacteriota bacterium]MDH3786434.1 sigma-70 family RNA polymerase sigma factor [Acidobacteriota bacterium]
MASSGKFKTTRWTVIRAARAKGEPGSAEALAGLCEAYWYPLYVFVRRSGHAVDAARDLTQGYFLKLLEKDYLDDVRPEAGKFRSFLLVSMKHFLANTRRDAAALKRGGGQPIVPLDIDMAEGRYRHEPVDDGSPERAYERQWAQAVIERARVRLRSEFEQAGKLRAYEFLSGHLTGAGRAKPYREIAAELETSEAAVKMSVSRMRRQFGKALREEVGDTIDEPADVDVEVKYLLTIL